MGFLLRFKILAHYQFIFQVVGVLALGLGLYFKGGFEVEQQWRDRVKAMEAKVAAAEAKSKEANAQIETRIIERVKIVKQNVVETQVKIQKEREVIDKDCSLINPTALDLYNLAVTNGGSNE